MMKRTKGFLLGFSSFVTTVGGTLELRVKDLHDVTILSYVQCNFVQNTEHYALQKESLIAYTELFIL